MGPACAGGVSARERALAASQLASARSFFASQICRRHSCSNPLKLSSLYLRSSLNQCEEIDLGVVVAAEVLTSQAWIWIDHIGCCSSDAHRIQCVHVPFFLACRYISRRRRRRRRRRSAAGASVSICLTAGIVAAASTELCQETAAAAIPPVSQTRVLCCRNLLDQQSSRCCVLLVMPVQCAPSCNGDDDVLVDPQGRYQCQLLELLVANSTVQIRGNLQLLICSS